MTSGFAEVIKYGAIKDRELFHLLETMQGRIHEQETPLLEEIISRSASIKMQIVEGDVFENGDRKLLNFGHTLGHAIEKLSGMLHGEAIAIGMVLAAKLSVNLGFLDPKEAERLEELIRRSGLPAETGHSTEVLFDTLLKDKKRSGDAIHFILLKTIGEGFIHTMKLSDLKAAINDLR
jgi:3-dehydroquinate synthase